MIGAHPSSARPSGRRRFVSPLHCIVACLLLPVACSTDAEGAADAAPDTAMDAAIPTGSDASSGGGEQGNPEILVGAFAIELVARVAATSEIAETPAYVSVIGRVDDGPTPKAVLWEPLSEAGGCVVLKPMLPFCDPGCGSGQVCAADDDCRDYPANLDVGTVTVTGLVAEDGTEEFSMEPLPTQHDIGATR